MLFKKKKEAKQIDYANLPKHIAFICDGNRRWARSRGLPQLLGHKEGVEAIKRVVRRAAEIGVEWLTFFCFSTENFNRSKEEVNYLFDLFRDIVKLVPDFVRDGYRFNHIGDRDLLPQDLLKIIDDVTDQTKGGKKGVVSIALAYGGRHDIISATKKIIEAGVKASDINEESFKNYLSTTQNMPDVDLLVRTSGEQRISGFMLYNMAYAELYFVKKHWPSFTASDVDDCISEFSTVRKRRFGK